MADDEDIQRQIDRLRLRIEDEHLYLEKWRIDVSPHHVEFLEWRKFGTAYAHGTLRSLFLLNGGALVAIPSFQAAFKGGLSVPYWSLMSFVAGLVAVILSGFFAFKAAEMYGNSADQHMEYNKLELKIARIQDAEELKMRQESAREKWVSYQKTGGHWEIAAVIGFCVSLSAFVFGCVNALN